MNSSERTLDALLVVAVQDLVDAELETARTMDTTDVEISRRTLRRVRRKIKQHTRKSWWADVPMVYRRAVASVLIACTVFLGMCMSVQAVRAEIASTILQWYDKFVSVFYITNEAPPEYIEEYREPMLQIAGTERRLLGKTESGYYIDYLLNDQIMIVYQQKVILDESIDIDSENECTRQFIKVNNYDAELFEYTNGERIVTWHDTEYAYIVHSLTNDYNAEMLISIAESVQ